jgi:hypothetical protein
MSPARAYLALKGQSRGYSQKGIALKGFGMSPVDIHALVADDAPVLVLSSA